MMALSFPSSPLHKPVTVRDVTLTPDDDAQTRREKIARIALNDLYQFVGLLNLDGTPLEINQSALSGAGLRLSDILGKPFWKARWWQASPEAEAFARNNMRRASAGEFVEGEVEVFGAAGGTERIIMVCSWTPIRDEQGRVIFVLAEARNITEKKRVEAELAAKNKELRHLITQIEHLSQLRDELFANVSHELRTPLALILGPASSMLMQHDLSETQRQNLETVHRNASTLLKYVNELLDLAKFDAGCIGIQYTEADAAGILREAAAHFDALAHQHDLDFQIAAPAALHAQLDVDKFERVVLNLLSNAFKSTPKGGKIRSVIETATTGKHLHLSIQDSGPGIDSSLHEAVFARFRQGADGHASTFSGTGLGLAIVKEFVELHGGSIRITEGELGGAAFDVLLPLHAPAGSPVSHNRPSTARPAWERHSGEVAAALRPILETTAQESGRDGEPMVLVAEDNPEMRHFISQVLGERYRLRLAATGEQALAMALEQAPDLILTDLMMPQLSGDRLVEAVRRQPALAQVPVIVLSAKADEALRLKLLNESVQDYVTKPFSPDELRARVKNLIILKQARDALQKELDSQNQDLSQLAQQLIASKQAQHRSFEAQRESQQLWRALYQHSAAGIALTDLDGRVLEANTAFQALLDYSEAELKHMSIDQLTPDGEQTETRERLRRLRDGQVAEYHVKRRYKRRDGSLVWAYASVSLIPGYGKRSPMLMRIVEDITERHLAEQKLQDAQNELARVTRATAMGELAASIAHEINQPLAGVVANAHAGLRWLAAPAPNIQEVHDAIQRIIRDANRASDVVTRIRGFLKRGEQRYASVSVRGMINETACFVREKARSEGVELRITVEDGCPSVLADRIQLQQVLLNLMINGMDAMRDVKDRPRLLDIQADGQHQHITISVRDHGIGLDPANQDRLFDAFYTSKPEGLGMGLSISHSIIEAHGGRLWAACNADGPGATFQFTIPLDGQGLP